MNLRFWTVGAVLSLGLVAPVSGAGIVDATSFSWSLWDVAHEPNLDLDMVLAMPAGLPLEAALPLGLPLDNEVPAVDDVPAVEVADIAPVVAPAPVIIADPAVVEPVQLVAEDTSLGSTPLTVEPAPLPLVRPVRFLIRPIVTPTRLTASVAVEEPAPAKRKLNFNNLWFIGAYR